MHVTSCDTVGLDSLSLSSEQTWQQTVSTVKHLIFAVKGVKFLAETFLVHHVTLNNINHVAVIFNILKWLLVFINQQQLQ